LITLSGAPLGGTWSGTGVTGNQFNPAAGTQIINYAVTQNGCTGSASTTITVNTAPTVSTGSYGPLCSGDASITLTGSPVGGTWSGTGVTGNQFDPTAGTQIINYAVTQNGCTGSASTTITVNTAPTVSTGSYGPLCSGDAAITLTGSPVGGTWSGIGVTGNEFDPAAGTQTINYTLTQNGCTGSGSTTITVVDSPAIIPGGYGPVCSNSGLVVLGGEPAGGIWSGNGVNGGQFDPSVGTQTITYTIGEGTACEQSATTTITVLVAPDAGFYVDVSDPLVNTPVVFVNTTTPDGSYQWDFGDGSFSAEQDPEHTYTVPGTYAVTLTVFLGDCSDSFTLDVTIDVGTSTSVIGSADIRVWGTDDHFVLDRGTASVGPLTIEVLDSRGRLLRSMQVVDGPDRVYLSNSGLSTGIWLVIVRGDDRIRTFRVPLLR
jgi:hypothetical protein